ncbi:MAG TPA: hypothetical protein VG934_01890 [Candidatus Paceibacterota bacterium]|nr:hypothetical protein [Candidatus Paceibacterota bacterium]
MIQKIQPLHDARLDLPPDHAFRFMCDDATELPADARGTLDIVTAAEIEAERLAAKRSQ